MTNADLIALLKTLPPDATVVREGGEYKGDERKVAEVTYRKLATLGGEGNRIILR